jgi:PIN domain nuclease of toxin-antitoxin system
MSVYVTDTHPLVWYAAGARSSLSRKALKAFDRAEDGRALIYVPAAALWEVSFLVKGGRFRPRQPFGQWAAAIFSRRGFEIAPLDVEVIDATLGISFNEDPFDHAIVATAMLKDLPLITRDEAITGANVVKVEW